MSDRSHQKISLTATSKVITMDENDAVQDVKVVLIGDAAGLTSSYRFVAHYSDCSPGKSAIMKKFFDGVFDDDTATTIGIDFRHITYQLQDGTVWDTAGQERFRKLAPSYIRDAHVILIVFDLTSTNIVEQIARWTFFAEKEREDGALVVLVGSKCDLRQRRHNKFIMERMMAEYNAPYVETSAKTGFNIDEMTFSFIHKMANVPHLSPSQLLLTQKVEKFANV
nr:Ras domain containing protein [Haemonchus contortus]